MERARKCKVCNRPLGTADLSFNLELSVIDSVGYKDHDLGAKIGDLFSPAEFKDSADIQAKVVKILESIVAFTTNTTDIDLSRLVKFAIAHS